MQYGNNFINVKKMSILRIILAIIFPPLAVVDKGCGTFLIVLILTAIGWLPGVIAAFFILYNEENRSNSVPEAEVIK